MRAALPSLLLLLVACGAKPESPADWAAAIEKAHGVEAWKKTTALRCDLRVTYDGETIVDHIFVFETNGPRARMETRADGVVVFDGTTAWGNGELAKDSVARFHVLTWPWFIAAPFKLRGKGTRLSPIETRRLDGTDYESSLQTFDAGTGDTPDDWYRLFVWPDTHLLHAMGYIVTYGKSVEEAERSPSLIVYHDYHPVQGVQISHRFDLWKWDEETGLVGDAPKGTGEILTATFVTPRPGTFEKVEGMVELKLP